ncbi:MAG: hypothetical protein EAY70_10920 [Sphingomonadales bacterium]|nr:MAG: hypothetical protein EAY70_10920 [Sphingomonadales bacterium]
MALSAQGIAQAASQLAAQGRDAEAEALYEQGLADFPDDARLANSVGNFHFKAGRLERALALFERARNHAWPALASRARGHPAPHARTMGRQQSRLLARARR